MQVLDGACGLAATVLQLVGLTTEATIKRNLQALDGCLVLMLLDGEHRGHVQQPCDLPDGCAIDILGRRRIDRLALGARLLGVQPVRRSCEP